MSREIKLTKGQVAIVDDEDFDVVNAMSWYAFETHGVWYAGNASRHRSPKILLMHRLITNAPAGMVVDHKNWDGLDNRKCNLRVCTNAENRKNGKPRK